MPEFQNPFKRCQGINSLVTVKPVPLCNHCDGKNEPKIKLKCRSNIVKKKCHQRCCLKALWQAF